MKLLLTIVKDTVKGEAANMPNYAKNVAEAKRSFAYAISKLEGNPEVPAKDLQLYSIGTFDTETLEIEAEVNFLCNASEYLKGE